MRFEYILLSIMSGDDLRRTLGDANNRITRISNSELGQILAVNRENQQEAQSEGGPVLQAERRSLFPTLNCATGRSFPGELKDKDSLVQVDVLKSGAVTLHEPGLMN